jgi:hypothetical protein
MQGVQLDMQSDDEALVRSDEHGQISNTVGCPIQGESSINSSSHVPEPCGQADMHDDDDGQPSMHEFQSDLRADSAVGLYPDNDGPHERTVSGLLQCSS